MYFVSLTRLRLRSIIYLPSFYMANERAVKQITHTDGFIKGFELIDKGLTFWTVSVWTTDAAMKYFRNNGAHQQAMRKLPGWCSEASYAHWMQETDTIPDWEFMYQKLINEGKVTKVKHPTERQAEKLYPPPAWRKSARNITPFKA